MNCGEAAFGFSRVTRSYRTADQTHQRRTKAPPRSRASPARCFHAQAKAQLRENVLDGLECRAAKIRDAHDFIFGFLHQIADIHDAVVLQRVDRPGARGRVHARPCASYALCTAFPRSRLSVGTSVPTSLTPPDVSPSTSTKCRPH